MSTRVPALRHHACDVRLKLECPPAGTGVPASCRERRPATVAANPRMKAHVPGPPATPVPGPRITPVPGPRAAEVILAKGSRSRRLVYAEDIPARPGVRAEWPAWVPG